MARRILLAALLSVIATTVSAQTVFVDQGDSWTSSLREQFYTRDQGARIMPLSWMRALKTPEGDPFLSDALARYGYLPMPGRDPSDLPVGFTTNGSGDDMAIGMTCAACHVRQIEVSGTAYRIDGGPALVDFQSFLADLDTATLALLSHDPVFEEFATAVLGDGADDSARQALHAEVEVWSNRFHTLIERSLPTPAWAPGRLDAVSMIFNRLAGLDLGDPADDHIIADNIAVADAPTRYPFLWNAAKQDKTQWPGFADNGNNLLGLARNLGEVYGVFGEFYPKKKSGLIYKHDFITDNSANWDGLGDLEDWIWDIGAPKWQWELDRSLAAEGAEVFNRDTAEGGCVECHGKRPGAFRPPSLKGTWATPVVPAGTDTRECNILTRTVQTGVLEGARKPFSLKTLGDTAPAFEVLSVSVIGAIIQHAADFTSAARTGEEASFSEEAFEANFDTLQGAFPTQDEGFEDLRTSGCAYEARVLDGIWAAAPYLHNGSVPTLTELLKKPEDRVASFTPGPNYDLDAVGLATDQTAFDQVIETTGCDDLDSGNSRCGHDWGTDLDPEDKRALLEYLKSI